MVPCHNTDSPVHPCLRPAHVSHGGAAQGARHTCQGAHHHSRREDLRAGAVCVLLSVAAASLWLSHTPRAAGGRIAQHCRRHRTCTHITASMRLGLPDAAGLLMRRTFACFWHFICLAQVNDALCDGPTDRLDYSLRQEADFVLKGGLRIAQAAHKLYAHQVCWRALLSCSTVGLQLQLGHGAQTGAQAPHLCSRAAQCLEHVRIGMPPATAAARHACCAGCILCHLQRPAAGAVLQAAPVAHQRPAGQVGGSWALL